MASETTPTTAPAAAAIAPIVKPAPTRRPSGPDKTGFYWGTGRRKTSVARVRIKLGSGKFLINDREIDNYFSEIRDRGDIVAPLKVTKTFGNIDVLINVQGGGLTGQAGAIVMGVSRALRGLDPTLEPVLREHGLLTRDDRKVERKKYGQAGARRRFQFSKR